MSTLFQPDVRDRLVARLATLTPDVRAKWGKFTATQMVAHLNESMRMALGALPVAPKRSPLKNAFFRWLVIYVAPFPKSAPTAPELLARLRRDPLELETERATFQQLLGDVAARKGAVTWPEHPVFGKMSERDWGTLGLKHTDHHFKQFGI